MRLPRLLMTTAMALAMGGGAAGADPASPSPTEAARLEQREIDAMVRAHNDVRRAVGVTAKLRWAEDLAAYAQEWADRKAATCELEHRQDDPLGENLFYASPLWSSDGRVEEQDVKPADVVTSWASEKADYRYATNRCARGAVCGHYTQIVWARTKEMGCGMSTCPDRSQIWVCNYRPAGNVIGEKPY